MSATNNYTSKEKPMDSVDRIYHRTMVMLSNGGSATVREGPDEIAEKVQGGGWFPVIAEPDGVKLWLNADLILGVTYETTQAEQTPKRVAELEERVKSFETRIAEKDNQSEERDKRLRELEDESKVLKAERDAKEEEKRQQEISRLNERVRELEQELEGKSGK
jgi:hypothetical protein